MGFIEPESDENVTEQFVVITGDLHTTIELVQLIDWQG
jgi:hypothetical protein